MLGEVEVALRDGKLVFDAGEVRSEMRPRVDEGRAGGGTTSSWTRRWRGRRR